jgi:hypothetical protein
MTVLPNISRIGKDGNVKEEVRKSRQRKGKGRNVKEEVRKSRQKKREGRICERRSKEE